MAKFTEEQQRFIVTALACFTRPTKIVEALKAEYNVEVKHRSSLSYYDPSNPASSGDLAQELVTLFWDTRRRFTENVEHIAIANHAYRLQELDALLDHEIVQMSPAMRCQVLEQAAKERGGMYQVRVSPVEVEKYLVELAEQLKASVDTHVTNPQERDRVKSEVKKHLEREGVGATR